jgi:hypothetical protein
MVFSQIDTRGKPSDSLVRFTAFAVVPKTKSFVCEHRGLLFPPRTSPGLLDWMNLLIAATITSQLSVKANEGLRHWRGRISAE